MRLALACLAISLCLGRASAQYVSEEIRVVEILERTQSGDPLAAEAAWKDFDRWASGQTDPVATLGTVRRQLKGIPLPAFDDAMARLKQGSQPGRMGAIQRDLSQILERLGSGEEILARDAMEDFEVWLIEARGEAEALLEAGRGEAPGRGYARAKERLAQAKRAREAEESVEGGDALKLRLMMADIGSHEGERAGKGREALAGWGWEAPELVRGLLEPWCGHVDGAVAAAARAAWRDLELVAKWRPVLGVFDTLAIPSVRNAFRVVLVRDQLPDFPGDADGALQQAWQLESSRRMSAVLLDDGTVRRGLIDFTVVAFEPFAAAKDRPATLGDFWRAALGVRWLLERCRHPEALETLRRLDSLGAASFADDKPDDLARRLLRFGADFLLQQVAGRVSDRVGADVWPRLAALPFDDCRRRAAGELERLRRIAAGEREWHPAETNEIAGWPGSKQVDYWLWNLLRGESERLANGQLGSFILAIDSADAGSGEPLAGLASVPWDAVPALIDALADSTPTGQWIGDRRLLVSDAVRFPLRRLLNGVVPLSWDPRRDSWEDPGDAFQDLQARARERFALLDGLNEGERRWESWRLAGCPPEDFVLEADPALCIDKAWSRISTVEGRRRDLQLLTLRKKLAKAPREKLEALIHSTQGGLRELVQEALDEQGK